MNKIRQKLTSQSGASITYALLLFLVCAVVSSVVLAAGTAASGRMSKSVESDQRYFNVTSATEYLINKINKQSYELKKGKALGSIYSPDVTSAATLLADISQAASETYETHNAITRTYTLSTTVSDVSDTTPYNVSIKATFKMFSDTNTTNPKMTMEISNADGTAGNKYTLYLSFTASIEDREDKDSFVRKVTWNYYSISNMPEVSASEP